MKKLAILKYACLVTLGLCAACLLVKVPKQDGLTRITMLNIGQGDSFFIQSAQGGQLLIDGGPDEAVLSELAKIMPPGDQSIDVVIATHPDADHIGGLPLVLSRYHIGLFLTTQAGTDSDTYKTMMHTIDMEHIPAYYARHGMTIVLGPKTTFSVLFPDRDTSGWETNTASVVGKLTIGSRTAIFTGDSPSSVESFLVDTIPKDIDVDILKLGHHGSKTSSSELFLKATSPMLALISAGINNRYHHPNQEVLDRLQHLSIPYISTQNVGTYTIKSDGEQWIYSNK